MRANYHEHYAAGTRTFVSPEFFIFTLLIADNNIGRMIPYIEIDPILIAGYPLSPFGVLIVLAAAVGIKLAMIRGRRLGVDVGELQYFIVVIAVFGLIGAHVLDVIFYYPSQLLENPWLLIELSNGLSSFGGFISAIIGGIFWKYYGLRDWFKVGKEQFRLPVRRVKPAAILPFADILTSVFPFAWILGRMGCAVVHDHLGILAPAGSWFAVAAGLGPVKHLGVIALHYGNQPRYDLGLLEMLFSILMAIGFALTWRFGGAKGWYVVAASLLYAPVRFALDFLRGTDSVTGDIRYLRLTPAQWACFILFAFGIALGIHIYKTQRGK